MVLNILLGAYLVGIGWSFWENGRVWVLTQTALCAVYGHVPLKAVPGGPSPGVLLGTGLFGGGWGFSLVYPRTPGDILVGTVPTKPSLVQPNPPRCTKPPWKSCTVGLKPCRSHWIYCTALTEPMTCFGTDEVFFLANDLCLVSHGASQEAAAFRPF